MRIKGALLIFVVIIFLGYLVVKDLNNKEIDDSLPEGNPPNSAENAPPGSIHNLPIPDGVAKARLALATRLNISESKILIMEALEAEWPDGCLGIQEKGTFCTQVITPGYNILMQASGREYRYRTNLSGSIVKAVN